MLSWFYYLEKKFVSTLNSLAYERNLSIEAFKEKQTIPFWPLEQNEEIAEYSYRYYITAI